MPHLIEQLIPLVRRRFPPHLGELCVEGLSRSTQDDLVDKLFFAIRGFQRDGHEFISKAIERGARAVVVEDETKLPEGVPYLLVKDTRLEYALASGRYFGMPSKSFTLVGITGTNGKTTSSYLLDALWGRMGFRTGLIGTVGCRVAGEQTESSLTTPDPFDLQKLFFEMKEKKIKLASMEVSSIALDQHRTAGTAFDVALFTNLTQDHLDYHKSMEAYFDAKCKLFESSHPPKAVINVGDPWGKRLYDRLGVSDKLSFSVSDPADLYFKDYELGPEETRARLISSQGEFEIRTPLVGKHNLSNLLGVLGVFEALSFKLSDVVSHIPFCLGAPGRLERVRGNDSAPNILVDYAHTPDALRNVLEILKELRSQHGGKIITVFGCGGDRDRSKRPQMAEVVSRVSDLTITTSDNPRTEDPDTILADMERGIDKASTEYVKEVDRKQAIYYALQNAKLGDWVLVAGKGHETYQIRGTQKFPFDDRQVIRDYYRE